MIFKFFGRFFLLGCALLCSDDPIKWKIAYATGKEAYVIQNKGDLLVIPNCTSGLIDAGPDESSRASAHMIEWGIWRAISFFREAKRVNGAPVFAKQNVIRKPVAVKPLLS
jgi:hypothetical protein